MYGIFRVAARLSRNRTRRTDEEAGFLRVTHCTSRKASLIHIGPPTKTTNPEEGDRPKRSSEE